MMILGINKIFKWVQITTGGRKYTCPYKEINGELFFAFKREWHKVVDYVSEYTEEIFLVGKNIVSRKVKK